MDKFVEIFEERSSKRGNICFFAYLNLFDKYAKRMFMIVFEEAKENPFGHRD